MAKPPRSDAATEAAPSKLGSWSKTAIVATLLSAIATCIIAWQSYKQLDVLSGQQSLMAEQLRVSQKPQLLLTIAPNPPEEQFVFYDRAGQPTEKWNLPYYVVNIGQGNAYNLKYWHDLTTVEEFSLPDSTKIQSRHDKDVISPNDMFECGMDHTLRQDVIDKRDAGVVLFRHFYVSFEDQYKNKYSFRATWRLVDYQIGSHPYWAKSAMRDLSKH